MAKDKEQRLSVEETLQQLETKRNGLSSQEAESRLQQYGKNTISEKKQNALLKFFGYFWGPIPWMIEAAIVLSAMVEHWADFYIISVLLLVNAIVGFWEEFQAGNTIEALKSKLAVKGRVMRDGTWQSISAEDLIPGDFIRLRIGEIVPADVILAPGDSIEIDQSALTGESLPVERGQGEKAYSGSIVKRGEIEAYVSATGKQTYFGKTAQLVDEAQSVSHFQKAVLKIGNYLIVIALFLVSFILGVAIDRGEHILKILEFCLVLTVAAIPVAMPTVLSITMAVGAKLLAYKQAIVTKLASIEELAGINILCSDKTGTLTQNKLSLGDPFTLEGIHKEDLIFNAALASREEDRDQIDLTILSGVKDKAQLKSYEILHFMPFDPVNKRTEAQVKDAEGNTFFVTKGAPQVILNLVGNAGKTQAEIEKTTQEFAEKGFRSLGVARADKEGEWQYLGIIPMFDPPREDAKETIKTAREMGIDVKMLTGDQVVIAKEIARRLDLGTNIIDAGTLGDMESEKTKEIIEKVDGFAQVFPEHKYHIVEGLEKGKNIIAMTGDGVNDAPALKKADVGIAVSGATDAARSAASIVLLQSGLSVIIDAIKESRKIFQRMTSYATYRIAETIRVLLFMTLSILVFNFYPVTAIMIVLLAILNDGSIISIAFDRVRYSNKPEAWNMPRVLKISTLLGVIGVVASFGLFFLGESVFHLKRDMIQTLMYLKLTVAGQLTIFLTRTTGPFWSFRPANILLAAVMANQILALCIVLSGFLMTPIPWHWAAFVWGYALLWFLVTDRIKLFAYKKMRVKGEGETSI